MNPATHSSNYLLDRLIGFFLPAPCLDCKTPLPWRTQPLNLCATCHTRLQRSDDENCRLCGATTSVGAWLCPHCRQDPPAFDCFLAGWRYQPPLDAVIRAFKFGRLEYLGRHLADALRRELAQQLDDHDVVVAVPLHWRRHLQRGFNQSALIAAPLARHLGLPNRALLRRVRATAPQSSLRRSARRVNVAGAFRSRSPRGGGINPRGARVLLVDDVATTGATLHEASLALKRAGVERITAVATAQTPHAKIAQLA